MSDFEHKPNVLLIHSDQHRFDCVGVNRAVAPPGPGRLLNTPNLDRIAAGGVNFTRAFTPIALCTPARASLATGTWPSRHGSWVIPNTLGYRPADESLPTWFRLAADAGYAVSYVGKYHQELVGTPADHGVTNYLPEEQYEAWRQGKNVAQRPATNGFWGETDPLPEGLGRLRWEADFAIRSLRESATAGRPFVVRWDPSEPHLPNVVPEPWASMFNPQDIPPWPSFPDDLVNKPTMQRRSRQRWGCDDWTWEQWQPIVARYLGEIALIDHHVGRVLDALDEVGLSDNTLVIYTTDHGDFCGGHGMVDKHYCGYDDILRVPLLARWPGKLPAGETCDRYVYQELDIARTLADLFAGDAPDTFCGRNLAKEAAGDDQARDCYFGQYSGTQQGRCDQRYLRTERWKYVYCPVSGDELYDLAADPGELTNVTDAPAHAEELLGLRQQMEKCLKETGDQLTGPLWTWPARTKP